MRRHAPDGSPVLTATAPGDRRLNTTNLVAKTGGVSYDARWGCDSQVTDQAPTVADAMLRFPKLCAPEVSAAELHDLFTDDHVHAVLVVTEGRLVTVVERPDLGTVPADRPAGELGQLAGRTVDAAENLEATRRRMRTNQIRRLAVVDNQSTLLGLLCLKSTGLGFCSDADVAARAAERWADQANCR